MSARGSAITVGVSRWSEARHATGPSSTSADAVTKNFSCAASAWYAIEFSSGSEHVVHYRRGGGSALSESLVSVRLPFAGTKTASVHRPGGSWR
jgi:hypothetical protein